VGVVDQDVDTELFSGASTALRAGRFYQIAATDLGTTPPSGTDVDCATGLPITISGPGVASGSDAVVASMCRMGTTCRLVSGIACPTGTSSFATFGWESGTSAPFVAGERIDLATHGELPSRARVSAIPLATDVRVEVGGGAEAYEIGLRTDGVGFTFDHVAAGLPLTPLEAACASLPASWLVRLGSTTATSPAGHVCSNSTGAMCDVASPGAACTAPASTFDVRFTAAGVPELYATTPWTFATSTHGTVAADLVTGLPRSTDVTVESLRSTGLHATTTLRFEGTSVRILSASLTP
jgi:hypothetical protein